MASPKKRSYFDYLAGASAKIPRSSLNRYKQRSQQNENITLPDEVCNIYETLVSVTSDVEFTERNEDHPEHVVPPMGDDREDTVLGLLEEITFFHGEDEELEMNANEFLLDNVSSFEFDDINIEMSEPTDEVGSEYLFNGSQIKVEEFVLLLLTFSSHCHISGTALRLLLKIIELVCPKDSRFKASMKEIFLFVKTLDVPLRCHYFCTDCFIYRGTEKNKEHCTCCRSTNTGYFIDIPMLGELKKILERLWNHMDYRFCRSAEEGVMQDIYDGKIYKKHFDDSNGFLRDKNNISLIGFTDGVSIFKSSGFSVWPVYFCINELPPKLRFRRENGVFAGLWFGKIKPHFPTFFKPFAETIWDLYENGMEIVTGTTEESKTVKALFLQMTCDAPAKCLFQNFKQFNGKYGCPYCLHPGESCQHNTGGQLTRSFIYDYRSEIADIGRSHKETCLHAEMAHKNKLQGKRQFDVFGVKGQSWALYLPYFDIIQSMCLDYMHAVLLGVTKQLMTLWFNSTYKNCDWSCITKLKQVQARLLNIKPTNNITRVPRSIEELHHWKASELRAWLLFYGQTCMNGILKESYFQHFLLLVESVWLLLQERISKIDIEQADRNLKYFCFQLKCLYGTRSLTFNMHQLLHLVQSVQNHGPLWTHSCFYFEDYNGQLRHFFHGTQNVEVQVLRTVAVIQSLPKLAKKLEDGSEVHTLYNVLTGSRPTLRAIEKIKENVYAVGNMVSVDLEMEKELALQLKTAFPHFDGQVCRFLRLLHQGDMLHSAIYQRVAQRNSFTVKFNEQFGQVAAYYRISNSCLCDTIYCNCNKKTRYYAFIVNLPIENVNIVTDDLTGLKMRHCVAVRKPIPAVAEFVEVHHINGKVLYADFDVKSDHAFVVSFPNHIEKD